MHYEEKHIDGVLHFRTRPDGAWEKKVSKQPEALEQAEYLEKGWFDEERNRITAAAELRRLHAANVELLEALGAAWKVIGPTSPTKDGVTAGYAVYEALKKHGSQS